MGFEFSREELWDIRGRAASEAEGAESEYWQRAYEALADAADRVDALIARSMDTAGRSVDCEP